MAQATGTYQEAPVEGALTDTFVCRWRHQGASPAAPGAVANVVPDGCVDLIWSNGRLHVAGPDRVYQAERIAPGEGIAGLRFHPGHASAWLGLPVSEIVNSRLPLAELWGSVADRLEEALAGSDPTVTQDLTLVGVLGEIAPRVEAVDRRWRAVPGLLVEAAARREPAVPWLMTELGLSERTLRRQVEAAFGYGPKTLDRILRFQRFLRLLRSERRPSLARLAIAAGYTDQAHLTRECRRLAGLTPGQIAADLRPGLGDATSGPDLVGREFDRCG